MLVTARHAHPDIEFREGRLDDLPVESASLAGAVCWYSIIYTPPERLDDAFRELKRVLLPGAHLLLAFQAGDGEAVHRTDAHGTGLPLTSYRHGIQDLAPRLHRTGFEVHATAQRAAGAGPRIDPPGLRDRASPIAGAHVLDCVGWGRDEPRWQSRILPTAQRGGVVGRCRSLVVLVMLALSLVPVSAGAADRPRPARYRDGTVTTWDSRTGGTRWTAVPDDGRYLDLGAIGRNVVVAQSGKCGDDGLVGGRPVGLDARTGDVRWRAKRKGVVLTPDIASGILSRRPGSGALPDCRRRPASASGTSAVSSWARTRQRSSCMPIRIRRRCRRRPDHRSGRWSFDLPTNAGPGFSVKVAASNARQTVLASGGFLGGGTTAAGVFTPFGPTTLVTVDSETGRELHRTVVADPELTFSTGVLHQDMLALINGREINGVDLASGQIAWRFAMPPPSSNYRGVLSSGLGGKVALYMSPTKTTVALDTATGATIWSRPLGMVGTGTAEAIVLLAPLRTYTKESIEGVDIATGRTRWTRTLKSTYAVPEPSLSQPRFIPMAVTCGTP